MNENKEKVDIITILFILMIMAVGTLVIIPTWGAWGFAKFIMNLLCLLVIIKFGTTVYILKKYDNWTSRSKMNLTVNGILIVIAVAMTLAF